MQSENREADKEDQPLGGFIFFTQQVARVRLRLRA